MNRSITCPGCGAASIRKDDKIPYCKSCGKKFDKNSEIFYQFNENKYKPANDEPALIPGLKGMLDGEEHEILGRVRYQDEESYGVDTWDEWYLISRTGARKWLVLEDGKFSMYTKYRPKQELSINKQGISFDGITIPEKKGYYQRIVHIDGQLPWDGKVGERSRAYDFKKDGNKFCIEKHIDQIEVYSSVSVKALDIFRGFNLTSCLQQYESQKKLQQTIKKMAWVYLIGALIFILFPVFYNRDPVAVKGIMNNPATSYNYSRLKYHYYWMHRLNVREYEPFILKGEETAYEITIYSRIPLYRRVEVRLMKKNGGSDIRVASFTGYGINMSRGNGTIFNFKLKGKGRYYIKVLSMTKSRIIYSQQIKKYKWEWKNKKWKNIKISIKAGKRTAGWLWIPVIFFFIIQIFNQLRKSRFRIKVCGIKM